MRSFSGINNIEFDLSEFCNLDCKYCYLQSGKKISSSENKLTPRVFDAFFENYVEHIEQLDSITVSFWGGEPLLNFKMIRYIVERFHPYRTEEREISFLLVTNGILLNREILEFCREYKIRMQLSVDGDKEAHDALRQTKSGDGTYETILAKADLCKKMGVDYHFLATLSAISAPLTQILEEFRSRGYKHPFFNIMNPITSQNYEHLHPVKSKEVIEELFEHFQREFEKDEEAALLNFPNIYFIFRRFFTSSQRKSCGVCSGRKAIKYDGTIYPCRRMVDSPERCIGSVWDGIDDPYLELYHSTIQTNDSCRACNYRLFCGGTCLHEIFERNNPQYVQSDLCEFMETLCFRTLKLIVGMLLEQDERLQRISKLMNGRIILGSCRGEAMSTSVELCTKLQKNKNAHSIDLEEEGVLYMENDFGNKYIANVTTMSIWDLVDGERTAKGIAAEIAEACGVEVEEIQDDIFKQIGSLVELGFFVPK
jgi:uncharacterized protein